MSTDYSALIEDAKLKLQKNIANFDANKRDIVNELKDKLVAAGMPKELICSFIIEKLAKTGYIGASTVKDALTDEFKDKSKARKPIEVCAGPSQTTVTNHSNNNTHSERKEIPIYTDGSKAANAAADMLNTILTPSRTEKLKDSAKDLKKEDDGMIKISEIPEEMLDGMLSKKMEKFAKDTNEANDDPFKKEKCDCTNHRMYIKAQAIIENQKDDISKLKARVDEFDANNFKPANQVESVFQIQRKSDMRAENEFFYEKIAPIDAIRKFKTKQKRLWNPATSKSDGGL